MTCQRVQVNSAALRCKVCRSVKERPGTASQYERIAYGVLDQLPCIKHYAVEAYAVPGPYKAGGHMVATNRHAWDIMTAPPLKILIEVHGEQHTHKLDTRINSNDSSLASRADRDHALAAAAQAAGYSVVWLMPKEERGRRRRWAQAISQAVHDQLHNCVPKLYIG
jgi:hypothetical protein